jgi:hypothetical protein
VVSSKIKTSQQYGDKKNFTHKKEWSMLCFALIDGIRARQELASNCRAAAESGVQTIDKQEKWD